MPSIPSGQNLVPTGHWCCDRWRRTTPRSSMICICCTLFMCCIYVLYEGINKLLKKNKKKIWYFMFLSHYFVIKYKKLWKLSYTIWSWTLTFNNFQTSRLNENSYQTFFEDRSISYKNMYWFLQNADLLERNKIPKKKKCFPVLFKWEIENHDETPLNINIKSSNFHGIFFVIFNIFD